MPDYPYANAPRQDILKMVPKDGMLIGSVGCGYGATEAELVRRGRKVFGVDVAPHVAEVAKANLTDFQLLNPGDPLPWAPRSLDGLILADVIEHVPRAWEILAEWVKVVRPGGWVVISVPNMHNAAALGRFVLTGDWPERDSGIFDRTHLQVMSPQRLRRWCNAAGLDVEKVFLNYDGTARRLFKFVDAVTFGVFNSWTNYQVQFLCRVREPASV